MPQQDLRAAGSYSEFLKFRIAVLGSGRSDDAPPSIKETDHDNAPFEDEDAVNSARLSDRTDVGRQPWRRQHRSMIFGPSAI